MALELTDAEKQYAKTQFQISELKKQREAIEKTASIQISKKRAEITAIQSELDSDLAAIDDQIKAIE